MIPTETARTHQWNFTLEQSLGFESNYIRVVRGSGRTSPPTTRTAIKPNPNFTQVRVVGIQQLPTIMPCKCSFGGAYLVGYKP